MSVPGAWLGVMTSTTSTVDPAVVPDDAAGVLAFARSRRAAADRAEADLLQAAVAWAVIHPAETLDGAVSLASRVHLEGADDQPVTLAGPGAPLVAEFSVAEFAAAIGVGTETGKHYWVTPWNCGIGCRGCGGGWWPVTWRRGRHAG